MLYTNMAHTTAFKNALLAFLTLFILVFACYSNTFHAAWHLDDYDKIVTAERVQIDDLTWDSLYQTFFLEAGERLYRPLSRLTLALNWYFGQDEVKGYHIVNIGIHFLSAWVLFLTLTHLLQAPNIKPHRTSEIVWIAFLASALWAVNPVQTQAVTYIVQRMASMATLFYLWAMYAYLKARTSPHPRQRTLWFLAVVAGFMLALGTKENALTLPLALFLVEIVFFQDVRTAKVKASIAIAVGVGLLVAGVGIVLMYVWKGDPLAYVVDLYAQRPFSPGERLLTQPRVLLFYLSQLFYPAPSRLSIAHDITVSSGLLSPWTTLPALLGVLALVGVGLVLIRKRPLIAFGLLFFFLNHLIESSVLPLELVFEHRNYLPSLFLFVPLAVGLIKAVNHYRGRKRLMHVVLVSFTALLLIGWGTGTYVRNQAWATEKTLWEDALHKAPGSSRVYHNLAWGHYQRAGLYTDALRYYKKALQLQGPANPSNYATYLNVAAIYLAVEDYQRAALFFKKTLELKPNHQKARHGLSQALLKIKEFDKTAEP